MNSSTGWKELVGRYGQVHGWSLASQLVAFAASIVLAHRLTPELFGLLALANAVAAYVATFARFGSELTVLRDLAGNGDLPQRFAELARQRWKLGVLGTLTCALICYSCWSPFKATIVTVAVVGAVILILDPAGLYDLQQRMARHAFVSWLRQLVHSLSAILAVLLLKGTIACATLLLARALVAGGYTRWVLHDRGVPWRQACSLAGRIDWRELVTRNGSAFVAVLAAQCLLNLDHVLISALLGDPALAPYAVATSLVQVGLLGVGALNRAIAPELTVRSAQRKGLGGWTRRIALLALLMVLLGIAFRLFAPWAIHALYPASLDAATRVLTPFACWIPLAGLGAISSTILLARRADHWIAWSLGIAAAANLALNLWLIPRYGIVGAAWGTLVGQLIATGIGIGAVLRSQPKPLPN